ncbi:AAA family ATPase [Amycolatopsis samaneae]|uniref:AAA family ATPase n=1 Tax=Amycolatopsis samaneae TaxID=664691 RepID=A0ABW5GVK1_9PSEU
MLTTLAVENYRSLRDLVLPLSRLTLVTGANGSGKSSLYRALRLLADASRGGAFAGDEFGYALDFGLPVPAETAFGLDPEFKRECVWSGPVLRPARLLADRAGPVVRTREAGGSWSEDKHEIRLTDSMLSEFADPRRAPELLMVRERIRSWRFYDHFRTDAAAPARVPRIGTRTPVLGHEGGDLAAALQTIRESGDDEALRGAIEHAFPGSTLEIGDVEGRFALRFRQHGLLRPLDAAELSDGTLRYLLWVAALLTPRPPELLVLNEPETSLHPDLLPALAALIAKAAKTAQLIVVSHARPLIHELESVSAGLGIEATTLALEKEFGQTVLSGQGPLDRPSWHWPKR